MKFLKKYNKFIIENIENDGIDNDAENVDEIEVAAPERQTITPGVKPDVKPGIKPQRRRKSSPIRRDRPAVEPAPKAENETSLPIATMEDVIKKYAKLTNQKY